MKILNRISFILFAVLLLSGFKNGNWYLDKTATCEDRLNQRDSCSLKDYITGHRLKIPTKLEFEKKGVWVNFDYQSNAKLYQLADSNQKACLLDTDDNYACYQSSSGDISFAIQEIDDFIYVHDLTFTRSYYLVYMRR